MSQRVLSRWSLASCALLLLAACAGSRDNGSITVSGFIEGEEFHIASELGGRIVEIPVDEGDEVVVGQVLVRLDDRLLQAQRAEALAAVAAAEANLARVQAGPRPAELTAARAALAQAEAQWEEARLALEHARQMVENPQELDLQIAEAQGQVLLAQQEVELRQADLRSLEVTARWDSASDALELEAARAAVEAAQAQLEGARRYLDVLRGTRTSPLTLLTQLHAAEAQAQGAEAAVEAARASLEALEAGPTPEEVSLAQAQLHQALAALALADARLALLTLTSPITGLVTSRSAHVGETAAPASVLLTLANLDRVTLVVYIPENQIGQVHIGQPVEVTVDSFPGRVFAGRVATIGSRAEFTPRNVQAREERVNLVFAVKVEIANADQALKPGMPADAVIRP